MSSLRCSGLLDNTCFSVFEGVADVDNVDEEEAEEEARCNGAGRLILLKSKGFVFLECNTCFPLPSFAFPTFFFVLSTASTSSEILV
jgi:hypothetical protein